MNRIPIRIEAKPEGTGSIVLGQNVRITNPKTGESIGRPHSATIRMNLGDAVSASIEFWIDSFDVVASMAPRQLVNYKNELEQRLRSVNELLERK